MGAALPRQNDGGTRGAHGEGGGEGGCQAAHRAEARRRDGDIAPYRHAAREGARVVGRGEGSVGGICAGVCQGCFT